MAHQTPMLMQPRTSAQRSPRHRNSGRALAAAIEALEPRVLLTGTYTPALLSGPVNLYGVNKDGSLVFDGVNGVTGMWSNQSGSPATNVITPSNYSVSTAGTVSLLLTTQAGNDTTNTTTSVTLGGVMNGTRDVVALNETSSGTPVANGLDVLVATGGTYTQSLVAGTWNIASQEFRGSITVNSAGQITAGSFYSEKTTKTASAVGGTVTLNESGTGSISITTNLPATSSFHTFALTFTMNAAHDVMAGNSPTLGDGTSAAQLTVLVKNAATATASQVVGSTWALNSALGQGSLNFLAGNAVSGSFTDTSGVVEHISGTYVLGGNGSVIVNMNVTAGSLTIHESFTGEINQHQNLIALDRAIANGTFSSSLMLLTNPADHAPTERLVATWPTSAFETSALTFDFNTLTGPTVATVNDLDKDTISLQVTPVNGTLFLLNGTVSTAITSGGATMVQGESLLWMPPTMSGLIQAFTIQASDGTLSAANATKIFVNTGPLPVVTATATHGNALEAKAGSASGFGTILLQRAGGTISAPLTVTVQVGGTAALNTNYTLVGPNGSFSSTTGTVTFLANQNTVTLNVEPLQDNTVDPTKTVTLTVEPDPNVSSPAYAPSVHPTATVNILDSNPTIVIVPVRQIRDGGTHEVAFFVERTPAQGGTLANLNNTVTITYSGTQNDYNGSSNVANDLPPGTVDNATSVTFTSDQVKEIIFLSPGDDGVAATEQVTATISNGSTANAFAIGSGMGSATINVTDDAPTVHLKTLIRTASEASPQTGFGEFQVIRTGSTASAMTVDIATGTTSGMALQGTNYTLVLANDTMQTLTSTVTIPAGASSVNVELMPIDDGLNDGKLKATVMLVPDITPSYHVGSADTSTIVILNNDRFPTVGNATFNSAGTVNTAVLITSLQTDTGDALAAGSNGTLQFEVGRVMAGTLQVENGTSGTFSPVHAHSIISAGETLKWTPPAGLHGTTATAFPLFGLDGNVESLSATLFTVTIA